MTSFLLFQSSVQAAVRLSCSKSYRASLPTGDQPASMCDPEMLQFFGNAVA